MAPWSNLATADIRWRLDGDLAGDPRGEATLWNGRNTVLMDQEQETAGAAYLRAERSSPSGRFEIVECDIAIGRWYAEIHKHVEPDHLSYYREFVVAMLVHEFGHCLGLGHSSAVLVPNLKAGAFDYTTLTPSLGGVGGLRNVDDVAADDVVGASLLRPAPGWRSGTGSIAGSLELDGEPLYEQFVWALPARDHPMRGGVGAYSDADGAFPIEGLDPGRYFLWGGPTVEGNGPLLKLHETLFGSPVEVRAGQTTAGLTLELRRGRVPRPPPQR